MFDEICQRQLVGFGCLILVNNTLARVLLTPRCVFAGISIPNPVPRASSFLTAM
jgi:hypothetical protein